jgi:hypothetical protein
MNVLERKKRGQDIYCPLSLFILVLVQFSYLRPFWGAAGKSITQRKPIYDLEESWYS